MTTQEQALDKAKSYKALTGTPIDDDIIETFESALTELAEIKKRAEPKKVIEDFMCYCPNCKEQLITGQENYNYCMHCGQRLDWNVEGETK